MRIYDPLNGLALLSEEPQVRATMVYAFCIHPHNVSLPAIESHTEAMLFFFNVNQRGNFGPGTKVFWGQDQRKL